jgi:hypothetical protein
MLSLGTVRIASGDPRGLDELKVDALLLPLFQAKAQPMAVAGYADWRLSGRIAKLLLKERFRGAVGETLLMPTNGRTGPSRVFLFGLGEPRDIAEMELSALAKKMATTLAQAAVKSVAVAAPELPGRLAPPRTVREERRDSRQQPIPIVTPGARMLGEWLEASKKATASFEEIVLLDPDGSLARADAHLADAAKRAGLSWV